eukprot:m.140228 g.140228  ORF g.140228 m.140228 type:complete len:492 (-) comp17653_c0_seq1:584-2059(-)
MDIAEKRDLVAAAEICKKSGLRPKRTMAIRKSGKSAEIDTSDRHQAVFGVELTKLPRSEFVKAKIAQKYRRIPRVFYEMTEMLREEGASEHEGIYRTSGSEVRMAAALKKYTVSGTFVTNLKITDLAGLQKRYLRDLPVGILAPVRSIFADLYQLEQDGTCTDVDITTAYNAAIRLLPREYLDLLLYFLEWMDVLIAHESLTKMGTSNLAMVHGCNLFHRNDNAPSLVEQTALNGATKSFLDRRAGMFQPSENMSHIIASLSDKEVEKKYAQLMSSSLVRRKSVGLANSVKQAAKRFVRRPSAHGEMSLQALSGSSGTSKRGTSTIAAMLRRTPVKTTSHRDIPPKSCLSNPRPLSDVHHIPALTLPAQTRPPLTIPASYTPRFVGGEHRTEAASEKENPSSSKPSIEISTVSEKSGTSPARKSSNKDKTYNLRSRISNNFTMTAASVGRRRSFNLQQNKQKSETLLDVLAQSDNNQAVQVDLYGKPTYMV